MRNASRLPGPHSFDEVRMGCASYHRNEPGGDAMYRISRRLIGENWGNPAEVSDAVAVLLLNWNQASYRYGEPDFHHFKWWMMSRWHTLSPLRRRDLEEFNEEQDAAWILELFEEALQALATGRGTRSPVGVVKAFHLLAPDFFPLWDDQIARTYGCKWNSCWEASEKYVRFMVLTRDILKRLVHATARQRQLRPQVARWMMCQQCPIGVRWHSLLKLLDEYNYTRYTKSWFEPG
ncbi:hypothetical protein MYX77_08360 [Acidobacteriia bacterium AH_259_A11_L15]|nr:hypothetical protein [Acidobacteriia bacterium AH_259_A11_L15]